MGPLSPRHGVSSGYGWKSLPPDMKGNYDLPSGLSFTPPQKTKLTSQRYY
jgi:hypothetical protein